MKEPSPLVLRWEDSLKRNDEVKHQVRRHVIVRLIAARCCDAGRVHGGIRCCGVLACVESPEISLSAGGRGRIRLVADGSMSVGRQFRNIQRVRRLAAPFTEDESITHMIRNASLKIGQGEVYPAIASVRSS